MSQDEFYRQILALFERYLDRPYTITGSADWPILVVVGGGLVALICFMWRDLRGIVKDNKRESEKDIEKLWQALKDCQHDCCPRSRSDSGDKRS